MVDPARIILDVDLTEDVDDVGAPAVRHALANRVWDWPLGPYKRIGKVLLEDPSVATGAGHHCHCSLAAANP